MQTIFLNLPIYIKPESKYYYIAVIAFAFILARIAYLFIVKVNIIKHNKENKQK